MYSALLTTVRTLKPGIKVKNRNLQIKTSEGTKTEQNDKNHIGISEASRHTDVTKVP